MSAKGTVTETEANVNGTSQTASRPALGSPLALLACTILHLRGQLVLGWDTRDVGVRWDNPPMPEVLQPTSPANCPKQAARILAMRPPALLLVTKPIWETSCGGWRFPGRYELLTWWVFHGGSRRKSIWWHNLEKED